MFAAARAGLHRALYWALATAGALAGCVTVYEPLGGLQKPVVLDVRAQNFQGTRIFVRCIPNKKFSTGDANDLCRRVSTLFTNQGAEVETTVPPDEEVQLISYSSGRPDLVVDLTSRQVFDHESGVMAMLSCLSCTLLPTVDEQSYLQEISVRDGDGAVLGTTKLKSRFVNYTGCGIWSVNWLLDVLLRPKEEALTGDGAQRDYSRDFYGQLSQVAFNALVRQRLLGEGPLPSTPPANGATAPPPTQEPALAPVPKQDAPSEVPPVPSILDPFALPSQGG